ncbi:hypothetical protein [Vogesella sp. LIG4]|uniref:hypothetical protein n=1 Tax=Vogesella sp. LIG4 TaxID=1192162 RepID=UPI00081FA676|nr:hypothetical protein [Vogesella sp. LIG4]SCK27786.1 hypothetical protein PSELUDRAFT_3386 [Vogesella sp. LIG4]
MDFHSFRYQASRPWARRVAQAFQQATTQQQGCDAAAAIVQRELEQAAQLHRISDTQRETEFVLAEAYGQFVRDGRRIHALDDSLQQALAHTRAPAAMPATLQLPAGTFMLQLAHAGQHSAAFVTHAPANHRLDMLLLQPDFAPAGSPWFARLEAALTLGINYPDSVQVPDTPALANWRPWLQAAFGSLTLLTQPRLHHSGSWLLPLSAAESAALAGDAKSQQKQRAELLKNGNQEVQLASMPGLPASWPQAVRAGYWRSQAGKQAQAERLVWVAPRAEAATETA